jgi:H+/gluconate symporter-like permease
MSTWEIACGLCGIFVSLGLLTYLAYRGVSVLVSAPLLAVVAVMFDSQSHVLAGYTQIFMVAMGGFAIKYFPIFLLGAIFGKLIQDSGSAEVIAAAIVRTVGKRHAVMATVLACGLLSYGGVSLFVVAFAIYPLAAALYRESDIPKRLLPAAIAAGAFTFSLGALPGTVQIHNMIPMPYFDTTAFAAPGLGTIGGVLMFAGAMLWLNGRVRSAHRAGEGYGAGDLDESGARLSGRAPSLARAIAPIVAVTVLNYVLSQHVVPRFNAGYLAETRYGATDLGRLVGTWSAIVAMAAGVALAAALHFRSFATLNRSITLGSAGALLPTFNTASVVGYGATVASLSAFAIVRDRLLLISPDQPLLSESVAISVLAAITGSASGGMSIALETLGNAYHDLALLHGVAPELMHRIASMSSGGLATLPHNGAVITLLTVCGLTHRQSYFDIAVVALAIPILATAVVLAGGMVLGCF